MKDDAPIAVMDATCALCSFAAKTIHRLDRSGDIRICPIQTERGKALLAENGLDSLDPDSWLFIEGDDVRHNFDAVIRLGQRCGSIGRIFVVLRIIPRPLRDRLYYFVARNRYRIFGRGDMCALPDPAFQARLIG